MTIGTTFTPKPSYKSKNAAEWACVNMFNVIYTPYPDTSCHVSLQLPCGNREERGVEHAVMGMHRWQTVLLQLISHNGHQLLHALIVVGPVTYNLRTRAQYDVTQRFPPECAVKHALKTPTYLQTVSQVTISIREVWLELQGSAVWCNRFRNVPRILQREKDVIWIQINTENHWKEINSPGF